MVVPVATGKGPLGAVLSSDAVLLWGQLLAPLLWRLQKPFVLVAHVISPAQLRQVRLYAGKDKGRLLAPGPTLVSCRRSV
jgi:hypothetical protein